MTEDTTESRVLLQGGLASLRTVHTAPSYYAGSSGWVLWAYDLASFLHELYECLLPATPSVSGFWKVSPR